MNKNKANQARPPNIEVDLDWLLDQIEDSENVRVMSHLVLHTADCGDVEARPCRCHTLAGFLKHVKHYQEQGAVVFIFRAYMMPLDNEDKGYRLMVRMAAKHRLSPENREN